MLNGNGNCCRRAAIIHYWSASRYRETTPPPLQPTHLTPQQTHWDNLYIQCVYQLELLPAILYYTTPFLEIRIIRRVMLRWRVRKFSSNRENFQSTQWYLLFWWTARAKPQRHGSPLNPEESVTISRVNLTLEFPVYLCCSLPWIHAFRKLFLNHPLRNCTCSKKAIYWYRRKSPGHFLGTDWSAYSGICSPMNLDRSWRIF